MADTTKSTLQQAEHKVAETAHKVADAASSIGHKIAEEAAHAANWVREKTGMTPDCSASKDQGVASIRERMDVIASCGKKMGVVDHIEGSVLKLTKKDSSDGQHHFVPTSWVAKVDSHVHLNKNSMETEQNWKSEASACGCGV